MANRWALLVAVEKPLHPERGSAAYAEADAKAWAEALVSAGVPKNQQFHLTNAYATKAAVESRLRRLKKLIKKGDELFLFWIGPGFTEESCGFLNCWDTLPDDAPATAIGAVELLASLEATKAGQVACFLAASGLAHEELASHFEQSPKAVGLLASEADEEALTAPAIKHGVWSQLVAEAFAGHARKAVTGGMMTALSLQRFLEDELPRRLRKYFEGNVRQTPVLFGRQNAGTVLAQFANVPDGSDAVLDAGRLRRLVFRSESTTRVRDLTNFRKTFTVPDTASPSNRKFVQRIATDDIRAELNRVFEECREQFGYKRKDLELTVGQDGTGTIRTPDFEFTLFVDLVTDEPSQIVWRREVGQFADADFIRSAEFQGGVGSQFDQLVFEFAKPVDVTEFIDRVEDTAPAGLKLKVGGEGKSCDITLTGFAGTVSVKRHAVVVRGRTGSGTGLLDLFLQVLSKFGSLGESLALLPTR
ncbi:hypothetical protein [Limnoglobus roseus]|uniref:Caspase family protein n=1 Tax=Limnoglobus roseus TaxID=2598579 RepID=A0A5C1AIP7_9BACT|nr:hypothetical protein [Limnoglobus roseus]QEL17876.1 hypothetical protein PX52LOC_04888 [Limnoglobus roseus]